MLSKLKWFKPQLNYLDQTPDQTGTVCMPPEVTTAVYAAGAAAAIAPFISQFIGSITSTDPSHRRFYDYWNHIYVFPEEYTELIDMLLIREPKAVVSSRILRSANHYIPGPGTHYFYWKDAGPM